MKTIKVFNAYWLIGFLLILLPSAIDANDEFTILGTIFNRADGKPVIEARIEISNTNYFTVTDQDGRYELSGIPGGRYEILVLSEGFAIASKRIKLPEDSGKILNFHMEKIGVVNEVIVVTATRTKRLLKNVPVPTNVITKDTIEKSSFKTVQQALRYLTSIQINESSSWGDRGKIEIMGLDETHTLVLLDGQRVFGGHGDAIDLQAYPVNMIEKIEVVKGPASSLYGSDALGGVVNIITKSSSEESFSFDVSPSFGSQNRQNHQISSNGALGKLSYNIGYTYNQSDGIDPETDYYSESAIQGSIKYEPSPDFQVSLKPYYSRNEMTDEDRVQERHSIALHSSWNPDPLSSLNLRASTFVFDNRWTDDDEETGYSDEILEAEVSYNRFLFNSHSVTVGYNFQQLTLENDNIDLYTNQQIHSVFFQDEMFYAPFTVVLGARIDNHEEWGTEFNPKASLLIEIADSLRLRASVGRAFRAPSLTKLYGSNWRMGPYLVMDNPDLEPETSVGYQAGLEWNLSSRLMFNVHWFLNDIDDLIEAQYTISGRPPYLMTWENIAEARTQGFETNIAAEIAEHVTLRLGYTYLDTEDLETGLELTYKAKNSLNFNFEWDIPSIDLNFLVNGRFIGNRFSDSDNEIELESYTLLNLCVSKDITSYLTLFVRVENILDVEDVEDSYYLDGVQYMAGFRLNPRF